MSGHTWSKYRPNRATPDSAILSAADSGRGMANGRAGLLADGKLDSTARLVSSRQGPCSRLDADNLMGRPTARLGRNSALKPAHSTSDIRKQAADTGRTAFLLITCVHLPQTTYNVRLYTIQNGPIVCSVYKCMGNNANYVQKNECLTHQTRKHSVTT